jgi:hypothetical protein
VCVCRVKSIFSDTAARSGDEGASFLAVLEVSATDTINEGGSREEDGRRCALGDILLRDTGFPGWVKCLGWSVNLSTEARSPDTSGIERVDGYPIHLLRRLIGFDAIGAAVSAFGEFGESVEGRSEVVSSRCLGARESLLIGQPGPVKCVRYLAMFLVQDPYFPAPQVTWRLLAWSEGSQAMRRPSSNSMT